MKVLRKYKITLVVCLLCFIFTTGCTGDDKPLSNGHNDNGLTHPEYIVHGLNFSCYTQPGQDPNMGTILSSEQIKDHLNIVAPYTEWVRFFGTSLGMNTVPPMAYKMGLFSAVGAWLDNDPTTNKTEMDNLITLAKDGYVDLAIIGSETLYRQDLSIDELISYIKLFQQEVPDVPVTTAETYDVWIRNPKLIDIVDVVAANFYSYWEGIHIDEAIAYIHSRYKLLVSKADGKEVIVSESGWPSDGETILQAEPTPENAAFHFLNFVSWAQAEGVKYFYFEAFDEPWKAAYEGPQGAHWGIWNSNGVMKNDMKRVFDGQTIDDNWTGSCLPGGSGTPEITLTYIPPLGSEEYLEGQVRHAESALYGVAVYIYVDGWWTKPYWNDPVTSINCNGSFVTDIVTGGSDSSATQIAAFLIPYDYDPPGMSGDSSFPIELYQNSIAHIIVDRDSTSPPSLKLPTSLALSCGFGDEVFQDWPAIIATLNQPAPLEGLSLRPTCTAFTGNPNPELMDFIIINFFQGDTVVSTPFVIPNTCPIPGACSATYTITESQSAQWEPFKAWAQQFIGQSITCSF